MKLTMSDGGELMEVDRIAARDGRLVITGTIMGALPVEAVLTGAEMRKALSVMSVGTLFSALRLFLFG